MSDEPREKEPPSDYQLIGPSEDGQLNDLLVTMSAKDSRLRLQALLAEWLHMENLVVLTGTGTSVPLSGKRDNLENAVLATVKALPKFPAGVAPELITR
jgi:hypothetical protein